MTESIDPAILLDTNESVEWSGRPRITTILPAVVIGVLLLVSGIVVSVTRETLLFLAVVPPRSGDPGLEVFRSARRAVRDNGRGTLRETRRVDPVCHTGKPRNRPEQLLWAGYHGIDLRIRLSYVRNRWWGRPLVPGDRGPSCNPALVDRAASNDDGLGGDSRRESGIPGDLSQWQQIRDEIRAIRSSLSESSSSGTARR